MPPENQLNNLEQEQAQLKSKNTLLWVIILVVAILVIAGLVAGYFVLNTEREITETQIESEETAIDTSDWLTYKNEDYGISFQYPSYLTLQTSKTWEDGMLFEIPCPVEMRKEYLNRLVDFRDPPLKMVFEANVFFDRNISEECRSDNYSEIANLSLLDYVLSSSWSEYQKASTNPNLRVSDIEEIIVDGVKGYKFDTWGRTVTSTIYLERNDTYAVLRVSNTSLAEQILSSIKFTNPVETSNWQTYRNEEYGFEFKYPPAGWFAKSFPNSYTLLDIQYIAELSSHKDGQGYMTVGLDYTGNDKTDSINSDINGEPAFSDIWRPSVKPEAVKPEGQSKQIYVPRINISITLHASSESNKVLIESIFSTFKFIDPTLSVDISDWQIYRNEIFNYEFKYPKGLSINSNDYDGGNPEKASSVAVRSPDRYKFTPDGEMVYYDYTKSQYGSGIHQLLNVQSFADVHPDLSLEEFANLYWTSNKEDKNPNISNKYTGPLEKVFVGETEAYRFNLTGSFHSDSGGYVLTHPNVYYFVSNSKGEKFMIRIPAELDISDKILSTFKFID